jgi:hypothetical protein
MICSDPLVAWSNPPYSVLFLRASASREPQHDYTGDEWQYAANGDCIGSPGRCRDGALQPYDTPAKRGKKTRPAGLPVAAIAICDRYNPGRINNRTNDAEFAANSQRHCPRVATIAAA